MDTNYTDPGLIQFWNFGLLTNQNNVAVEPTLEYCICHNYGYIAHMEWCPSGGYSLTKSDTEDVFTRLGLLAIASSNSFVYIYAVPRPGGSRYNN